MKKILSLFIALVLILSSSAIAFGQASDYENTWAENEINYMKEKGIINGYPDGRFKPINNMTKAEFYKVVNGLMGYVEISEVEFEDVNSDDWFYEEVQKGFAAKYILSSEKLNPGDNITRAEVARIVAFIFGVEKNEEAARSFVDNISFTTELKGIIGGLRDSGFIKGYPDGTFRPDGEITRAEVVKMLYDIAGEIINEAGTVSKDIETNVVVNTSDVELKDMTIEGNLYLTEGIGDGDVILDNVVVNGALRINGGGANSVIIRNSKLSKVTIDKQQGIVRVVFENTSVKEVKTVKEVKLELTEGTEIEVVELDGKVEVVIDKGATVVTLDAVSKEIVIEAKGKIESLVSTAEIKVNGQTVKADTKVKVENGEVTEEESAKPAPRPGGGSGGSGGGETSGPGTDPGTPPSGPTENEARQAFNQAASGTTVIGTGDNIATIIYNGDYTATVKVPSIASINAGFIDIFTKVNSLGVKAVKFNSSWISVDQTEAINLAANVAGNVVTEGEEYSITFDARIEQNGTPFEQEFTVVFVITP